MFELSSEDYGKRIHTRATHCGKRNPDASWVEIKRICPCTDKVCCFAHSFKARSRSSNELGLGILEVTFEAERVEPEAVACLSGRNLAFLGVSTIVDRIRL